MSLHEQPALKEKLYIRLGRAAFVLRYETWQRDRAAQAALLQSAAQQPVNHLELQATVDYPSQSGACVHPAIPMTSDPDSYHPVIQRPHEYKIVEFTYVSPQDGSEAYIDIGLKKDDSLRRLRFHGPQDLQITKGFPDSSGLVILDVSSRHLDGIGVRVINREAHDGCPEFWARDVTEQ